MGAARDRIEFIVNMRMKKSGTTSTRSTAAADDRSAISVYGLNIVTTD